MPLAGLRSAEHGVHSERFLRECLGAALRADVHEARAAINQLVPRLVNEQAADQAVGVPDVPAADVRAGRGVLRGGAALKDAVPVPVRDGRLGAEVARTARAAGGLKQRTAPASRASLLGRDADALALREQRLRGGGVQSVRGDVRRRPLARFVLVQEPAPCRRRRQRRRRRRRRGGRRRRRRRRRRVGRRRPQRRVRRRVEENLRRAESRAVFARLAQPAFARAQRVDRRLEGVRLKLQQNLEFLHGLQNLLLHGDGRVQNLERLLRLALQLLQRRVSDFQQSLPVIAQALLVRGGVTAGQGERVDRFLQISHRRVHFLRNHGELALNRCQSGGIVVHVGGFRPGGGRGVGRDVRATRVGQGIIQRAGNLLAEVAREQSTSPGRGRGRRSVSRCVEAVR